MKSLLEKIRGGGPKERFSAGLDIGSQFIKVVKLRLAKDATELCGFSIEPAQFNLAEALKNIKQALGIEAVNISLGGPSTLLRDVSFPRMNQAELKQALKFEAEKHIPFSLAEVNLDSHILKEDLPASKMLVLLAAAKKDLVNQRLSLLEEAGLKAGVIDLDSLALINAFNCAYSSGEPLEQKTVALLNIGAGITNLNILEEGVLRLSRDIHLGGKNFTQKIADTLNLDFRAAEELKINPEAESADKIRAAVESALANLINEIRVSFDYYESQGASSVAKIFLSGGSSRLAGLDKMLANLLGIEAEYWDPLRQITLSAKIDPAQVKASCAQLAVAVGLALR